MTAKLARPSGEAGRQPPSRSRRLIYLAPVAVFAVLAGLFAIGLTLDPSRLPSALIGKPVPAFDLPPLPGRPPGLASADLRGEVSLVNVFASWCTACKAEHPFWMRLAERGIVPIHALDYKDKPEEARAWLNDLGDPYTRIGADREGRVAIDWGVYGVPETFVVDHNGTIVYKHVGPIDAEVLEAKLLPLVRKLQARSD